MDNTTAGRAGVFLSELCLGADPEQGLRGMALVHLHGQ